MRAIGTYIIIDELPEEVKKTSGGLLLNEQTREDLRYRKGKIISLGESISVLNEGEVILYDKASGTGIDAGDKEYKVIMLRDVIAVV